MRLHSEVDVLDVEPGGTAQIPLEVVNTGTVIDGVTAKVLGLPVELVSTAPAVLPLFPDSSGRLAVRLDLPGTFPAGTHPVTVEVSGQAAGSAPVHHDVDLVVGSQARLVTGAVPTVVRARRKGVFEVEVRNEGNVPLDVLLRADDTDRALQCRIGPSTLALAPGGVGRSVVQVKAPRLLFGGDRDRPLRVRAQAAEQTSTVPLVLRQKPLLSRGLLTVLVLLAIILAWAAIFLFGIRGVLGQDPYTKTAPPSFFAATSAATADGAPDGAVDAVPAGAVGKDGVLAAGVGGVLTGTVVGASDGQGVGRITVEALRQSRDGLVLAGSAATQSDGSYTIGGLFPGQYLLRFAATGYDPVWYPAAPAQSGARPVTATAQQATDGLDVALTGHPASIEGVVDVGDVASPVEATVVARAAWAAEDETLTFEVSAAADGSYLLEGLPSPGTYELTFLAPGYRTTTISERVVGGQHRFASRVRLGSGTGQISGVVTDGARPVGGVEVTTSVDGTPVTVGTPTVGAVGSFVVPGLPTPGTYVLTFSADGFGERTVVVDLVAGEVRSDLEVVLQGGVGTVSGRVVDAGGAGVGGVSVTVGGSPTAMTATTLTAGQVGAFTLSGLTPGTYTLTFSQSGYLPQSVPVEVGAAQPAPLRVVLQPATGRIEGVVRQGATGVAGVEVRATDGRREWTTTSTSGSGGPAGFYTVAELPPGTYTVTLSQAGRVVESAVVAVLAGGTATRDLAWPGSG